jgi:hypothetical protein
MEVLALLIGGHFGLCKFLENMVKVEICCFPVEISLGRSVVVQENC